MGRRRSEDVKSNEGRRRVGSERTKEKKKKLLIYAHYYVPDVASTGQILKELAEGMLDVFDITVICVVPSYGGKVDPEYRRNQFLS